MARQEGRRQPRQAAYGAWVFTLLALVATVYANPDDEVISSLPVASAILVSSARHSTALGNDPRRKVLYTDKGAELTVKGINPMKDAMLFVTPTKKDSLEPDSSSVASVVCGCSHWTIQLRSATATDPADLLPADTPFSFMVVPFTTAGLTGGYVHGEDGTLHRGTRDVHVVRVSVGTYEIKLQPEQQLSASSGWLILQVTGAMAENKSISDNAVATYSYTSLGALVVSVTRIEAGSSLPTPADADFQFVWLSASHPTMLPDGGEGVRMKSHFGVGFMVGMIITMLFAAVAYVGLKYYIHGTLSHRGLPLASTLDDLEETLMPMAN